MLSNRFSLVDMQSKQKQNKTIIPLFRFSRFDPFSLVTAIGGATAIQKYSVKTLLVSWGPVATSIWLVQIMLDRGSENVRIRNNGLSSVNCVLLSYSSKNTTVLCSPKFLMKGFYCDLFLTWYIPWWWKAINPKVASHQILEEWPHISLLIKGCQFFRNCMLDVNH